MTEDVPALVAELRTHRDDLALAAGELLVDIPTPGTDAARLMRANIRMRRERDAALLRAETAEARLDDVLRLSETWPLRSIVETLAGATEHLLDVHNCDTHGHECFRYAANGAREWLAKGGDQ